MFAKYKLTSLLPSTIVISSLCIVPAKVASPEVSNVKTSAPLVTSYKEKDPAPLIACLQVWSVAKSLVKSIKSEVV